MPTGIDFTTFRFGTSITDTSLLLPLVVNSNFSSGVSAKLPHPLPDQEILLDFELLGVDHRMPMKGTTIRIELPIQRSKAKRTRIAELVSG